MWNCPRCGREVSGQGFCRYCGADLRTYAAPVPKKSSANLPVIIMSAVAGVLLIAAAVLFVLVLQKPSAETGTTPNTMPTLAPSQGSLTEQQPPAESATTFASASAGSVLPDQSGHSYAPSNVLRNDDTCWVENAPGYGEGEWILFDLPSRQRVSGLYLVNGYAGSADQYDYNSKISKIQLDFSDGSSTVVNLQVYGSSMRKTIQNIRFDKPVDTEYVKLTILGTEPGKCEDTCLTYVAPY
ncbi:MAG: discoidin domain-containing protein [Ruminococcus sp.]